MFQLSSEMRQVGTGKSQGRLQLTVPVGWALKTFYELAAGPRTAGHGSPHLLLRSGTLYLQWDTLPPVGHSTSSGTLYLQWDTLPPVGHYLQGGTLPSGGHSTSRGALYPQGDTTSRGALYPQGTLYLQGALYPQGDTLPPGGNYPQGDTLPPGGHSTSSRHSTFIGTLYHQGGALYH